MIKKRFTVVFLCVMLLLTVCSQTVKADLPQTNLAVASGCRSIDASVPIMGQNKLVNNVQSAFIYETGSQTLMYAYHADQPMYPASLVKIMTALLVLRQGILTDEVTVSQNALNSLSPDALSVDLQAGEIITVENLMYCLMVESANDAAVVLAEYVSGSQDSFVAMMNEQAAELGCTGTNFTNPHGLHNALQVTTARDVCRILQAALEYEFFCTIFGTLHYTVPATNLHGERHLSTNNFLMNNTDGVAFHYDSRVTGGRTGVTTEGFRCIASTSESGNMELICIVLGSASAYSNSGHVISYGGLWETSNLLDMAFSGYTVKQIIYDNQILHQQSVLNGDSDVFAASNQVFSAVLPFGTTLEQLSFQYTDAPGSTQAPVKRGQNIGSVQVWYGSMCITETNVYAMNDVPVASVKRIEITQDSTSERTWIWIAVIVIAVIIATVAVFRFCFMFAQQYRGKRRSKNIKRRH